MWWLGTGFFDSLEANKGTRTIQPVPPRIEEDTGMCFQDARSRVAFITAKDKLLTAASLEEAATPSQLKAYFSQNSVDKNVIHQLMTEFGFMEDRVATKRFVTAQLQAGQEACKVKLPPNLA